MSLEQFTGDPKPLTRLTEITEKDKRLLQEVLLHREPDSRKYENSWGYVIQATRYGPLKWYDPNDESLIFFGRKSDVDRTLVVPTFFAKPEYLAQVIQTVQNITRTSGTVLKNVDSNAVAQYQKVGFRPYGEGEGWSTEARFDDQTFPQLVVDLEAMTEAAGARYHKLKNVINRKPDYTIRPYYGQDRNAVLSLLAEKDGSSDAIADKIRGQYYVSHDMYPTAEVEKFVVSDNKTNEIIGFTATSDISLSSTALVAAIFKPGVRDLGTWGIYQTLTVKYEEGFLIANLGGCEVPGTVEFKRQTFQPIESIEKTHLVFDP